MDSINIGIVGYGKIARDQHVPALSADPNYRLIAITEGTHPAPEGVRVFRTLEGMMAGTPDLHAVSLCTPPQGRYALARSAVARGLHVMMDKPPGQTLSEVEDLVKAAHARSVTVFGTWHSREAAAVEDARVRLERSTIHDVTVLWKEDVRRWHPGQAWIWQPGGFGVFDPGINALSIVTRILPRPVFVTGSQLSFPSNRAMPIAAGLTMTDALGASVRAEFDWRQIGAQTWDISVTTDRGRLCLSDGGAKLSVDGQPVATEASEEYPNLYKRFRTLVDQGATDVDLAPLRLVADAFLLAQRHTVEAFND